MVDENDVKKIKTALRKVWSWSSSRREVLKRCTLPGGYARCEGCRKKVPKVHVDHIEPVGTFDDGFISRLFVSAAKMQGLCHECHKKKTKLDNIAIKNKKAETEDFF